jgi:hypothetical protein
MKKSIGCIIGALLGLAGIAQATVVFNFDGATANAATASSNIVGTAATINAGASKTLTLAYNTSTPLLSSNGGTYTGQSVYGGFSGTYSNVSASAYTHNFAVLQYANGASVEDLRSADTFTNNQISRAVGLALLFGPASAGNYQFDGTSVLTAKTGSTLSGTGEARWVVVANGTTYLSSSTFNPSGLNITTTLDNPDAINWAAWTPGADMTFGSLSYTNLGSSLNNITLAGVAVNYTAAASDTGTGSRYVLSGFTADVIPEPATVGMLGLGALLTLALRRRMTR